METTSNNESKEYTFSAEYKYVTTDQVTVTANSEEEARELALEQMQYMKVPIWKNVLDGGFEPSVNEIEEKWVYEIPEWIQKLEAEELA